MRVIVLLLLATTPLAAQLSGTYSIDPTLPAGGRNYQTIGAATQALASGISANVTFDLAPTTFNEVLFLSGPGTTSTAFSLTFEATRGRATISPPVTNQRYGIEIRPGARKITIKNLFVTGFLDTGILIEGGGTGVLGCTFESLEVDNGTTFWPNAAALEVRNLNENLLFRNCIFRANGWPAFHDDALGAVYDGCEFDGKGKSVRCFGISYPSASMPRSIVRNCLLHGCAPDQEALDIQGNVDGFVFAHNTVIVSTAEPAVKITTGSQGNWRDAISFRNNIVVNFGPAPAIQYEWDPNDDQVHPIAADHNAFWSPNSPVTIVIGTVSNPTFGGSLAQFRLWQQANPTVIIPGGASSYDANSIEGDPRLVSMTAPYDVRLLPDSPLIDAGTTEIVPAYMPGAATFVTNDFEGQPRSAPVDIGADEAYVALTLSGTGQIGTTVQYDLSAPLDAGLPYQLASSLGTGPISLDGRALRLSFDGVMWLSISGLAPTVFERYGRLLDASGNGVARLNVPNAPPLIGIAIHSAFVTIDTNATPVIRTVSHTASFRIQ